MRSRIRVGAVSYLNTRPLVYGLERGLGRERIDLSFEVPSALADRMAAGDLDVGLLPVVELARMPELEIVPGLGIVTRGRSRSVLLASRKPLDEIRCVGLDAESRTSNALVRVLFDGPWRSRPRFVAGDGDPGRALAACDAVVRIGDKALFEPLEGARFLYDMAEAWTDWTGLPFVFATWSARPGTMDRGLYRMLHESRRRGSKALEEIARAYRWNGAPRPEPALDYLTRFIHFRLGRAEIEGMKRFLGAAARLGLIERAPEIRLVTRRWTPCHDAAERARVAAPGTR